MEGFIYDKATAGRLAEPWVNLRSNRFLIERPNADPWPWGRAGKAYGASDLPTWDQGLRFGWCWKDHVATRCSVKFELAAWRTVLCWDENLRCDHAACSSG
jgi:hypothetical protein